MSFTLVCVYLHSCKSPDDKIWTPASIKFTSKIVRVFIPLFYPRKKWGNCLIDGGWATVGKNFNRAFPYFFSRNRLLNFGISAATGLSLSTIWCTKIVGLFAVRFRGHANNFFRQTTKDRELGRWQSKAAGVVGTTWVKTHSMQPDHIFSLLL